MSDLRSSDLTLTVITDDPFVDEAHLAAAAFLARYSGRTLDASRYNLRTFFQWGFRCEPRRPRGEATSH